MIFAEVNVSSQLGETDAAHGRMARKVAETFFVCVWQVDDFVKPFSVYGQRGDHVGVERACLLAYVAAEYVAFCVECVGQSLATVLNGVVRRASARVHNIVVSQFHYGIIGTGLDAPGAVSAQVSLRTSCGSSF